VTDDVRFLQSRHGVRIAYAVRGSGPPLVFVPPWSSHLVAETALSGTNRLLGLLSMQHRVIRYDRWGTGLSERARDDFSLARDVEVLDDLVEHLKLRRFALFGASHGGPAAVTIAHAQPRRVSHLILYGNRTSGLTSGETWAAMRSLIEANWRVAARAIAAVATRGGEPADVATFASVLDEAATPDVLIALQEAAIETDVDALLPELRVPTLVLHRRADALVDPEESAQIAARIPGARLELLPGQAHVFSVGDVDTLAGRVLAFTAGSGRQPSAQLSRREAEVLELVAEGCTNAEVAERLVLSVRTVERHLLNAYTKLGVRGRAEAAARWLSREPA
jgi:pimeloyl-ACP methyl ester carboxylesterase/DNA-binding CsgD family transcriptional regulator